MHFQSDEKLPLTVRLAHSINRLLTWGMPRDIRRRYLSEALADWEAMANETGPHRVLWRALRGVPAAIWGRLDDHDVTSLPAGIALSMVGIGGLAASAQSVAYPAPFRRSAMVAAFGFLLVGINFVRSPRRVILRRYRPVGVVVAAGFAGLALTLPTNAQWPYDAPVLAHPVVDGAMQLSFVIISLAFVALVAASLVPARFGLATKAGLILIVGAVVHGFAQLAWGIWMATVDLAATAPSVVIGLAALSFAHVLPRLRHIEIVHPEDETGPRRTGADRTNLRKGTS